MAQKPAACAGPLPPPERDLRHVPPRCLGADANDAPCATILTGLIDGGDVIVVQAKGRNLTRDGKRYDNDYAFVIHFRDGKIAQYEEYCDTDLIARVLPDRSAAKLMPKPT